MGSIADRLKEAMPKDGIREFHRQMKGREVRGFSRAMIHRYLAGQTVPAVDFLEEAADVLGVRRAWLILGVPPKTEDERPELLEELAKDAAAQLLPSAEDRQLVMQTFLGAMRRLVWSIETKPEREQVRRLADLLVQVVKGPSRRLLLPADVRAITDHYVAMIHAVMLLFPPWRSVDSIETLIEKLEANGG